MSEPVIKDRPELEYYEIVVDGKRAGLAAYELAGNVIAFTHTEIDDAYEGQGLGSQLARAALDDARTRGLKVKPLCPFIRGWIKRHDDYADLVARAA